MIACRVCSTISILRLLAEELEAARRAGVHAVQVPSPEFDWLAAEGERMIFVMVGKKLLASKRQVLGQPITHAVLEGGPVEAAGEFEVIDVDGAKVVTALNNMSGHYRPDQSSLAVAREAFEARGLRVLQGAVEQYDWLAS